MIYLIQGSDTVKSRNKYDSLIDSLLARKKDSVAWKIDNENFDEARFRELIVSQDLFVKKCIIGCDHLIGSKKTADFILENLEELKNSENIFIILEDVLDDKILKQVKKFVEKDLSYDRTLEKGKEFNVFAVTDALGAKNRKKLWVLYQEALRSGISAEDLFWRIQWMIKNLLFFKVSKHPEKSELKGFAKSKIQTFARNFTTEELLKHSEDLVRLFHLVRKSKADFETGLEKLIFRI